VQPDNFDALVSSLYAASYRAGGWDVALEGLRDAFDLDAFALIRYPNAAAGSDQPQVISVCGSRVSAGAARRYEEYYGDIDPRTRFVRQSRRQGRSVLASRVIRIEQCPAGLHSRAARSTSSALDPPTDGGVRAGTCRGASRALAGLR